MPIRAAQMHREHGQLTRDRDGTAVEGTGWNSLAWGESEDFPDGAAAPAAAALASLPAVPASWSDDRLACASGVVDPCVAAAACVL